MVFCKGSVDKMTGVSSGTFVFGFEPVAGFDPADVAPNSRFEADDTIYSLKFHKDFCKEHHLHHKCLKYRAPPFNMPAAISCSCQAP
jgi:hypothetical protein